MDAVTLCLAIVTSLSEILPLLGFTQANGVLHGLHCTFLHLSADSQCHVEVDVEARSPAQSPQREQAPLTAQSTAIALSSSSGGGAAAAATAGAAPGAAAGPAAIAAFAAAPP
jgi:hypothetical protein